MAGSRDHLLTLPCRYGSITFPRADAVVGESLQAYGEWAQAEIELLLDLTPPGGTVIDAGAFVGTHSLALAGKVGPEGRVVAIEAQPEIRALLEENVEQNALRWIHVLHAAIDRQPGILRFPRLDLAAAANFAASCALDGRPVTGSSETIEVEATTLDALVAERVDLIKADLEGMEVQALEGGRRILSSDRPHLYLECASVSNGLRLLDFLHGQGYRVFLHRAPAFNPNNYFGNEKRIFGLARETNLLAVAEERIGEVASLLERSAEVVPVEGLDDLAFLYLTTARWGEPEWSKLSKAGLIARLSRLLQDQERLETLVRAARLDQQAAEADAERAREELAGTSRLLADESARHEHEVAGLVRERGVEAEAARRTVDEVERSRAEEAEHAAAEISHLRLLLAALAGGRSEVAHGEAAGHVANGEEAPAPTTALRGIERAPERIAAIVERLRDSPLFDHRFYLESNPDLHLADIDPLVHYVLQGAAEGRDPHPLFDTSHYLQQAPESVAGGGNPLLHFVADGFRRGVDPHPLFLTRHYLERAPECLRSGVDPLTHYLTVGGRRGLDPHPLFDSSFYLARHARPGSQNASPLADFLLAGASAGGDPHPLFSCSDYLGMYPEIAEVGVNPLLHFVVEGRQRGFLPRRLFDLANDKHVLTELDRLRHDGRNVVLFVTGDADGEVEDALQEIDAAIQQRCVTMRLTPADPRIFGEAARGLLTLTAMRRETRGLLFDPRQQLGKLVTVLRGIGVTRVHVHGVSGHAQPVREVLAALALPIDLSPSAGDLEGRRPHRPRRGPPAQQDRPALVARLKNRLRPFAQGADPGGVDEWLTVTAERILVPSAHAAKGFRRRRPGTRPLVAPPPDPPDHAQIEVTPARLQPDRPLRVAAVWEAIQHDEAEIVEACAERAHARRLPLELLPAGAWPSRLRTSGPTFEAVSAQDLGELLRQLAPDVVWFPTRWPPSYSRRLDEALRTGRPVMVPDLGAYPEQVAGRPWSWVVAGSPGAAAWCKTLAEVRERLIAAAPPPLPSGVEHDRRFYPDGYLAARGLR